MNPERLELALKQLNNEDQSLGNFNFSMLSPAKHLDWFEGFMEFLVASSAEIMRNPYYAAWHLRQSVAFHQTIVLDSYHMRPSPDDVLRAAVNCMATYVMAPMFEDADDTIANTLNLREIYPKYVSIIGSCHGKTVEDGIKCFRMFMEHNISMIGFYVSPTRMELIQALSDHHLLEFRDNYFLYGANSIQELEKISAIGEYEWLLYTNAPYIATRMSKEVTDTLPDDDAINLNHPLTDVELYDLTANVIKFRELLPLPIADDVMNDTEDDDDDD